MHLEPAFDSQSISEPSGSEISPPRPATVCLTPPITPSALALAGELRCSRTLADLLERRGLTNPDQIQRFLAPKLRDLTPPDQMADRGLAAERLARALRSREKIAVFGDYDCDGMTSAAILCEGFSLLGGEVQPFVASRFDGGYGVSAAACRRILESGARLLVTCDCGSSDHDNLAALKAQGVDVVVIDHHLVPEQALPVLAFLNPHRPECGFPYKHLASCGLALSVLAALRAELKVELDLRRFLDLVAIGTIADVAPLHGDNRALVRAGLAKLRQAERPGVRALLELGKFDAVTPITGEDVAYRIAPRLNAPGRLGAPDPALQLLLASDLDRARTLAQQVEELSLERRAQQDRMLAEAIEDVEASGQLTAAAIVVGRQGWNHGVVGIVAGRLVSRYQRPVVVVGFDERGHGRGSVRGPRGARLFDALSSASECMERFGGHQAAAGLEVQQTKLCELREAFSFACQQAPTSDAGLDGIAAWLHTDDSPQRVLEDLMRLEPCGEGNPAPQLALTADLLSAREVKGGHLKLELGLPGRRLMSGFGFGMGPRADVLGKSVTLLGRLRRDSWRGGQAVEIRVDEIVG